MLLACGHPVFCPFGDDPGTTDNADFALQFTIDTTDAGSALAGTVDFWFSGQTTSVSLDASGDDATEAECKTTWESLPNVATAVCFKGDVEATTKSTTWTVRLQFDNGYMNNLHSHNGNPPLSEFACNMYVRKKMAAGVLVAGEQRVLTCPVVTTRAQGLCDWWKWYRVVCDHRV